jgi:outer membrane autotransporter protein
MDCTGEDRSGRLHSDQSARRRGKSGRKFEFIGAATVAVAVSACSTAQAQNCTGNFTVNVPGFSRIPVPISFSSSFSPGVSAANALISSITAANTAFLTQSTAFVSAPPDPKPDQQGGGVWVRGVGGGLDLKTGSSINGSALGAGANPVGGAIGCATHFRQDFAGVQFGQDIARLNAFGGWNLHLGTTAGYLETHGSSIGGNSIGGAFTSSTQAPFVGTYAVATYGNFYIDAVYRRNLFETTIDSPSLNISNQKLSSHGNSFASSMGYKYDVPNSIWFYEPSLGVVWSSVSVDPLNLPGPTAALGFGTTGNFPGTVQFNDIDSVIGRAGLRVGYTTTSGNMIYQPFFAVSVWHEFGKDVTANFFTCPGCTPTPPGLVTAAISNQNIGTYGQYSLGVNGQLMNSGWLGFARVDYRNGDRLDGWSGTGGIRYQYTPGSSPLDMAFAMVDVADHAMAYAAKVTKTAPVFVTKAKPMVERPYNWTGWYLGGFGGADYGKGHMDFGSFSADPHTAGALLGGTLGYNSQVGSWVWGIEADAGWTNANGSVGCNNPLAAGQPLFLTDCRDKADWITTLTGRLGLAMGRALYYVKGGGAWVSESYSLVCHQAPGAVPPLSCINPAGAPLATASAGDTRSGWTVGYGAEFGLTERWSAKGEVSLIGLGKKSLTATDGTVFNAGMDVVEGKVGVNYRLSP